ncbi:MAG: caspase family protein [Symploca sp. SIO3E6]|nr:caspase family protein [Caldora sp. SIO3E6]
MTKRRALLIGVPEYESDRIEDLPVVCKDLEVLNSSLEQSGYLVRSLGGDNAAQLTRNRIINSLRRECREARGVDILLLYFSGHGLHYNGRDYLVPADAFLDDPEYIEEYLVSTDLSNIIDQADAKTIIFVIDACREGVKLEVKQTYLTAWSRGERRKASRRNFVVVFACGSGQMSQYIGGEAGFSLFSKALAEVLAPQHPACTLGEVLEATKSRLDAFVTQHLKQPQQIHYSCESLVDTTPLSQVICESLTAKTLRGEASYSWAEAALESSLWQETRRHGDAETRGWGDAGMGRRGISPKISFTPEENSTESRLKQQFIRIITACWQQWQASIQAMPDDPWRDENLPIRVLESLELLVLRSNPPVQLSAAEVALVIAVPFVREAVLASALVQAAKANPLACEATDATGSFRDSLHKLHQSEPRFFRKAKLLKEQGQIAEKDAVMSWLVHRCLRKTLEVWIPESEGGYLADDFVKGLQKFGRCSNRLVRDALNWKRLLELARCTLVDPERIDREDRPDALQSRLVVGSYSEEQPIREKMLAYLLKMAWLLAIDIRHLSTVLVDHIGMADPLDLNDLHRLVRVC